MIVCVSDREIETEHTFSASAFYDKRTKSEIGEGEGKEGNYKRNG